MNQNELSQAITCGLDRFTKKWLYILIVTMFCFYLLGSCTDIERDSTDGESRSNMSLRIDALTGCHYLEGRNGGIIPRISIDGKTHYGCKDNEGKQAEINRRIDKEL